MRFFVKIYRWLFHSALRKSQERYWNEVRENQKNSKWEYFDKK